jgi:hypothetical protein
MATFAAAALALAVPAAASAADVTSVVMFSEAGDFIGQGQPRLFTSANALIVGHVSADRSFLTVDVDGGPLGDRFSFAFAAPPGQPLVPGVYEHAERAAFRSAGHPGLDINGDGRGCNDVGGAFAVRDLAVNPH